MPTFDMMKIGANIMRARKAKGMTQMQLANALGISFQAVSNWERGQSCPDISKLGELSELLDVSIDEILGNRRAAELVAQDEAMEKHSAADKENDDPRVAVFTVNTTDDKTDAGDEPDVSLKLTGKFPLSSVAEVAPFLSEKFVDMLVEKAIDGGEAASGEDIAALAPFMSDEALKKAAEKLSGGWTDLGPVTALAPFLETETLDRIALEAAEAVGSVGLSQLAGLAPFLSEKAIAALLERPSKDGEADLGALAALAPFAPEEALDGLARRMYADGDDLSELSGIAPFLSEETVTELAAKYIKKHGLKGAAPLMPFIDSYLLEKWLIEGVTGDGEEE